MNVKKYLALIIAIMLTMTILSPLGVNTVKAEVPEVITLQNGLNGYQGSIDVSTIKEYTLEDPSSWMGYYAEGQSGTIKVQDDGVKGHNGLISFDVSQIPAGSTITSAQLKMYAFWGAITSGTIDLFRITDTDNKGMWVEGDKQFPGEECYRSSGAAFLRRDGAFNLEENPGWTDESGSSIMDSVAMNEGVPVASASLSLPAGGIGWKTFELANDIQAFVNGTEVNQGWYIRPRIGLGISTFFVSNQAEKCEDVNYDIAYRPQLVISYTTSGTTTTSPTATINPTPTSTVNSTPTINPTPTLTQTASPTATAVATGKTFYVATTGSNTNNGSQGSPWLTLKHASRQVSAGDTVIMAGGTYANDVLWSFATGTAEAPITFKAAEGETPILTGSGEWGQILHFESMNKYFIIDGINTLNTSGTTPVYIINTNNITFRNCSFKNNAGEASTIMQINQSSYITVENCEFDTTGGDLLGAGEGDGIYVNAGDHCIIQDNYFKKCGHYAVDFKDYNNAGATTSFNNVFRNNVVEQYWGGGVSTIFGANHNLIENNTLNYIGVECSYPKTGVQIAADRNIVRNNIIGWAGDGTGGMSVNNSISLLSYRLNGMDQHCTDNRVYNNTSYKAGGKPIMISERHNTILTGNKVLNNIFYYNRTAGNNETWWPNGNWYFLVETYHSNSFDVWNSSFPRDNSFYNNIWKHADSTGDDFTNIPMFYYDGGRVSASSFGKTLNQMQTDYPLYFYGNKEEAPLFVNADEGDFSVEAGSPAIDAGANLTFTLGTRTNVDTVIVDDALFFTDGYGIITGDSIVIGSNEPVTITGINYDTNTLTISQTLSFKAGDSVNLEFKGMGPDIGTLESDLPGPTPEPTPTETPTGTPTETPTGTPTQTQTATPTATPTETQTATPTPTPIPFTDLAGYDWALEYINKLSSAGIINGYPGLIFKPYEKITRAEFVTMLVNAYDIPLYEGPTFFSDVREEEWYYKYVLAAEEAGLTIGNGDGTFAPASFLTREEMFIFNARALNEYQDEPILSNNDAETAEILSNFIDGETVSSWAKGFVATNIKLGLVTGSEVEGGMAIHPLNPITRAEVAVVLGRGM